VEAPRDINGYDPYANTGGCKYDDVAAEHAVTFIQKLCCHTKGKDAGRPLILSDWQADSTRTLFGWKRPDGTRRYREAGIWVPRKNGKTTWLAGIGVYLLAGDGEAGAEVYSAASNKDQASIMHGIACSMVRRSQVLSDAIEVRKSINRLNYPSGDSFYRAIPCEAPSAHGFNPHGILSDEISEWDHNARDFWAALTTGLGSRTQPLTLTISTAGYDRESLAYEQFDYGKKVRDGLINDPYFLPVMYYAEEDDDWTSVETWKKANPNYGVSVIPAFLEEQCRKAKELPSRENDFRQRHLNQWTEQETRFIQMDRWKLCQGVYPTLDNMPCFGGIDLSSTVDLTAFVLVFPIGGKYYVKAWHFIPEYGAKKREDRDRVPYRLWRDQGHINTTPGERIDYSFVRQVINEAAQDYDIKSIAFDPYNAHKLVAELEDDGHEMVKFQQTALNFNSPTKNLEKHILEGSLVHDDNPVMTWQASNLAVLTDSNGNIKPVKPKHESAARIDGMVAMLMALGLAEQDKNEESVYNSRGLIEL